MSLSDFLSDAVDLVKGVRIPPELSKHVELDILGKHVRLSHEVVRRLVAWAAEAEGGDDVTLDEMAWTPRGYRTRIATGGTVVTTTLVPQRVTWRPGELTVGITTPEGAAIEGRPILNFFLAAVGLLVGGTGLAEAILSSPLPPQIRWNGKAAVCTIATPGMSLPSWVADAATVTATFTPDQSGLWVRSDQVAHLVSLVASLIGLFGKEM